MLRSKGLRKLTGLLLTLCPATLLAADYFPLSEGARWELSSPAVAGRMVFEVTGKAGRGYTVNWKNPWNPAKFAWRQETGRIFIAGIDMGKGMIRLPESVYFDFTRGEGERWTSSLGSFEVVKRDAQVSTPAGSFSGCIVIRTRDKGGNPMVWTFAPDAGIVQFGEGDTAFRLVSSNRMAVARASEPVPAAKAKAAPPVAARAVRTAGLETMAIAVQANAPASDASLPAQERAYEKAFGSGSAYIHFAPRWVDIEPEPGRYRYEDIDFHKKLADRFDKPVLLLFRPIDTVNRTVPKAYERLRFDDPKLIEAQGRVLRMLASRIGARVKWVHIGEEINIYFESRRNELPAWRKFLEAGCAEVHSAFNGAACSTTFSEGKLADFETTYAGLLGAVDHVSFSYYPVSPEGRARPADTAGPDIDNMVALAGGKPVFFQEIGFPSAAASNSSEQKQAEFVENAFAALAAHRDSVLGAGFFFLYDFGERTTRSLTGYYKMERFDSFRAYLGSLGLLREDGTPKPAWAVFERYALKGK